MMMIIIHTVWISDKACSYSCFLLKPPAVQNLASVAQCVIWKQPTYDRNIIHYSGKCRVVPEPTDRISRYRCLLLLKVLFSSLFFNYCGAGAWRVHLLSIA